MSDKYYFVLDPIGESIVRASITKTFSYGEFSILPWAGLILIIIGGGLASWSYRYKPKVPSGLLDTVKTRGRVRISELAQEFGTTEARIEIGVYELMRAGQPIRFEAETREVVYG